MSSTRQKNSVFRFLFLSSVLCFLSSVVFSATTVCKWKDNKVGAFSMSFDDSMQTHAFYGIPLMAARGLVGTFFVVPGGASWSNGVMVWESLCSRTGMDPENHTLYHDNGGTDVTKFDFQIRETSNILYSLRAPGTSKFQLFVQPGSGIWPAQSDINTVLANYNAVGSRGVGIATMNGAGGLASAKSTLQAAISGGNWSHYYWHGLGPGAEWLYFDRGWLADDFLTFLDYIVTYSSQVWVGTSLDITKYKAEYDVCAVSTVEDTAIIVRVNLTSTADPALYDYPLTLRTDISGGWQFAKISQNGRTLTVKPVNSGKVMYDVVPNRGEISLVSASAIPPSPPPPLAVRDGTGADIDTVSEIDKISANWDECIDLESGISKYWVKAGISPGSSELFDWIDNGTFTYVTTSRTYLRLSRGSTYYVTVKAVNGVGNESTGISDGQYVPLTSGYIKFSDDFEYGDTRNWEWALQAGGNTIQVASEAKYQGNYGIKCHVQDTNSAYVHKGSISTISSNFLKFNFKLMNLTLPPLILSDPDYGSKLLGIAKMGDATDKLSALLLIGNNTDPVTNQQMYCMYVEFQDATDWQCLPAWMSKYTNYFPVSTGTWHCVDIHTDANPQATPRNVVMELWLDGVKLGAFIGDATGRDARSLDLGAYTIGNGVSADIYYDNVAWSDCLFTLGGSIPSPVVDTTNPGSITQVRDGTGTDIVATTSTTQLSANWDASTDPESGISKYWYAIGTSPAGTDLAGWTSVGNITAVTKTGLTLTAGQRYYFSVKAENGAGLQSTPANSNGQTVVNPGEEVPGVASISPNPYSLSRPGGMKFVINTAAGGEVKIYTMSGKLVREVQGESGTGEINWDGTNQDGQKVASGVYFYILKDASGSKKGKIAVVK